MTNPVVTITMDNGDVMKAELYPEIAPNTVNNFISLINKGFYDGKIFHRVISGFMIQGGCPNGNGMGGPGYCIKGEFSQNRFKNDLKHTPGVLSMARAMAITVNPARICGVADRMGSLEPGKDADIAIFSGNPMEVFTQTRYTIIDGQVVYGEKEDRTGESR